MIAVVILLSGGCLVLGVWLVLENRRRRMAVERMAHQWRMEAEQGAKAISPIPAWMRQGMRMLLPMGERLTNEAERKRLVLLLDQAGHPWGMGVTDLLGFRLLCAACGALAGGLFSGGWPMLVGALGGYMGVAWWLRSVAAGREAQIRVDLPDFLDAVSISLRAGVPIEQALRLVTAHFNGPLHDEFARFLDETALGLPRATALRRVMERTTCKELELLALALVHGLQLGVPLSETFMVQARALRTSRAQRARQLAGKATPKITMVSTLLVTPSVLGLIIGILVLNFVFNPELMGFKEFFN